jgi:isopentenyl-diphosphate delta-isomerase
MSRQQRKKDHLKYAIKTAQVPVQHGFSDIYLVYEALPELNLEQVDTSVEFLGKKLKAPLLINAITGGHADVRQINRSLARGAALAGIAMAVGSQTAGLDDPAVRDTYIVARDENPDGVLLANLSALAAPAKAKDAVGMIDADGIQLHLNVAQELAMTEGDRNFRGILANIAKIVDQSPVPVIIKEVGYGISLETVRKLHDIGVKYVDVGGKGGTDFIKIEYMRSDRDYQGSFQNIGIPAAASLIEALSLDLPVSVVASGGFTGGTDVVSALTLGAKLVGMAGHFLQVLFAGGEQGLIERINDIIDELRKTMVMVGAGDLVELTSKPVIITGFTAEWLLRRGVDITRYSRRS